MRFGLRSRPTAVGENLTYFLRFAMAPIDPHSYTDSTHPLTTSIDLHLKVDFETKLISGTARLKLAFKAAGILYLDTRDLTIEAARDSSGKPVRFSLDKPADAIKGTLLELYLEDDEVTITYHTSPTATALQWLSPQQTAGGHQPYVFTQCQPIHARSVLPCQDTPLSRIKYTASVEVPLSAAVVMGAAPLGREERGEVAVERFVMEQSIPPYLFALAAGDITFADVSDRCRVYAEPSALKAAAYEFAGMEDMVQTAERLFGPYRWEKFNVLVMPPSFPYGGMENPRMTFLTPTIVVGDRSLVKVVAHELAHSWTGNLISNATANDFWLNEGWTTYAQRRIIEALSGREAMLMDACIGWSALQSTVAGFNDSPQYTQLKMDLAGVDPDQVYSEVPYEKGYLFVSRLEAQVGREAFDLFIQNYIATFNFQSITTETFIGFLTSNFPQIGKDVDLDVWVHGQGIPRDAIEPKSETLTKVKSLAEGFEGGLDLAAKDVANWSAAEWQIYLEALPLVLPHNRLATLDRDFSLSTSPNSEIRVAFLTIGANSAYSPCYDAIEKSLNTIGRMKFLTPLYKGLIASGQRELAWTYFQEAKDKYHPVAQAVVAGLFEKAA